MKPTKSKEILNQDMYHTTLFLSGIHLIGNVLHTEYNKQ